MKKMKIQGFPGARKDGLTRRPRNEATLRRDGNRKLWCWRGQERGKGRHGYDHTYPR